MRHIIFVLPLVLFGCNQTVVSDDAGWEHNGNTVDADFYDSGNTVDAGSYDANLDAQPDVIKANYCAIPGASYLVHFTQVSGNCGDLPDSLININNDGSLPNSGMTCQSLQTNGCTSNGTNCQFSSNGISCVETFTTTFYQDGSGGQSTIELSCQGSGVNCSSIYDATYSKQ